VTGLEHHLMLPYHSCIHYQIIYLGYRWSLDFAEPLPVTLHHNMYALVMVDHFFKCIELVAFPDKYSKGVAYAFLNRVLSQFGALAMVLTNQGM
jgi:hypothetical protein